MNDREILQKATEEWLAGAGISLTVRTVLHMLQVLETAYGDNFKLDGAIRALDSLVANAEGIKKTLIKIQEEEK